MTSARKAEQVRLQRRLPELLARGYTVQRAAKVLGRSERTVWAWLADDPSLRERAADIQEDIDPQAVDVLRELLSHPDPNIRIKAATVLLRAPTEGEGRQENQIVTLVVHRTADGEDVITEQDNGTPEDPVVEPVIIF